MPGTWTDFIAPEWIDPDAFLFMGADPSWTPEKEEKLNGCEDSAKNRCQLCGGDGEYLRDEWGNTLFDPQTKLPAFALVPQIDTGSHAVCARCMRYGRPWEIARRSVQQARRRLQPERPKADEAEETAAPPALTVDKVVPGRGTIEIPERFASMLE